MLRSLFDEFNMRLEDAQCDGLNIPGRTVSVATGVAAYPTVVELCEKIKSLCPNLNIKIHKIINNFFGESITVTGLLTGKDIYEQLKGVDLGDELLVPQNALRTGDDVFLCDMTLAELSDKLGIKVRASGADGYELAEAILGVGQV